MSIPVKSTVDILTNLIADFQQDSKTGIATYKHSVWWDIFFQPLADQISDMEIIVDFVSRSRSLDELELVVRDASYQDRLRFALNLSFPDVQTLISNTIDNLISNWNEVRRPAVQARGYIRLYFNSSNPVTLSSGIHVQTLDGIQFLTTNSFTSFVPLYDSNEGLYYIDSAIKAVNAGQTGNVEIGSIKQLSGGVPDLVKIINLFRTKFGKDRESDLEVINRNRSAWSARRNSVLKGFIDRVGAYEGVLDVTVILNGNELMTRKDKNAVDVYLLAEEKVQSKEDIFNSVDARYAWERINDELNFEIYPTAYSASDEYAFKLLSQPAINISAVSYSSTPSGSFTDIGSAYAFNQDTTGVFAYSVKGHDHVVLNAGAVPDNSWVKIEYTYDRLYKDLQTLFDNYENKIIGADLLFKKGIELPVDITIYDMKVITGYVEADVKDVVENDLRLFFEGGTDSNSVIRLFSGLGASLDTSDLLQVALNVQGVDRMNTDLFTATVNGVDIGQTTTVPLNSYMRLNSVTFITSGVTINEINTGRNG